jgi:hypothetical protein
VPSQPFYVSGNFAIGPGQWVSLDGTTTIAQNGTWMAVGTNADVWIVTTPASSPGFTFLGYLSAEHIAAAQQPPAGPPPPVGPVNPAPAPPPPGAPQLPPPSLPSNPQNNQLPFGALGGGLIIPDPNTIPAVYHLGRGFSFVVPAVGDPYYSIPIYPDGKIRIYPIPGGKLAIGITLPKFYNLFWICLYPGDDDFHFRSADDGPCVMDDSGAVAECAGEWL